MAAIISYNQIIDVFKDISQRHYQLNTLFLGKDWEIGNNTDVLYPMLQIYPTFARMPISSQGEYKTVEFDLNCKVVDLVNQSEINERDVQSDTLRIAQDIVNELNQHPYYINSNASIIGDIQFDSLEEFEDDFAAGWAFTIRMRLININTYCGLPFAELDGYSANGPVSTGYSQSVSYLTCSNVLDCTTLTDYITDEIDEALTGITGENYYTTGTTLFGNTIVYNRNDAMSAYTTDLTPILTGLSTDNFYTTGATFDNNTSIITFNRNDTLSAYTVNLSTLSPDLTGYVTKSGDTMTGQLNVPIISATTYLNLPTDIRVTGGTYSTGTATFTNNTGGTFSVSGFSTSTGGGETFTGGTVSGATDFTSTISSGGTDLNLVFVQPHTVETLSNKRNTKRVVSVASSATPTLNTDTCDIARLTGLTVNISNASTNLTGTPNHGDLFCYEITDNGVARTLSWGALFTASGTLSLPTTTVLSTLLKVLFQWNSATNTWVIIAWV